MKTLTRRFVPATALVASLILSIPLSVGVGHAADKAKGTIGTTATGEKIPTTEEARAALLMPDDPNPVPGQELVSAAVSPDGAAKSTTASGSNDPTAATGGQAAVGGPMAPGASAGGANTSTPGGSSETTGARSAGAMKDTRPGPIGATGQTMPSKISERNAILDRVPIMAMPLALTEQQRQRIYQTVMADKSRSAMVGAEALAPALELSTEQALNEAQAFPPSLQDIELLKGLQYVKAKDKVLLVRLPTRTVVDEITL